MDYTRFFAKRATRRKGNLIRQLTEMRSTHPEAISMAGGMPNSDTFPFKEMSITYAGDMCTKLSGADLNDALQYGPAQGHLPLVKKYRDFQQKWHAPPCKDWEVTFMTGSQDGFCKVLDLVLEEGEPIMVQIPTYTAILGAVRTFAPSFIGIRQDADGIIPEEIEKACDERVRKNQTLPKLLYVNPIGANPTGALLTYRRKQRVYELAKKYNFLIIEDDAYYFIHFGDKQPASFLSMDTDGRVIRLDSFSKIVSAGLRLGVVTANKAIINPLRIHVENSVLQPSSLSQMLIYKLFENWSDDRFEQHFKEIQGFYRKRRDVMLAAVEKHLTGLAEWSVPKGGMFVWIRLTTIENALDLTMEKFVPNGVFVIPGNAFNYNGSLPDRHLRLSYSFATPDEVEKGLSIIARIIREETAKKPGTVRVH